MKINLKNYRGIQESPFIKGAGARRATGGSLTSEKLRVNSEENKICKANFDVGAGLVSARKENRGITLIALIITIIIMLILVAVSVRILIDSNLIGIAQEAADKTKTAYEQESNMGGIEIDGVKYDSIDDYINKIPSSGIKIKLSMVNTPVPVTADEANVSEIKEGVPIPVGFYYVGGTKNTGVVISDNINDANKGDGHNVELEGNQFVWVPVLQNQKLKIEIKTEEPITGIKVEDELFREITEDKNGNPISATGTSYTAEINPTINGTYTVTVTAGDKTIEKTLRVSSLYAQDFWIEQWVPVLELQLKEMAGDMTVDDFLATGAIPGLTSTDELPKFAASSCASCTDSNVSEYSNSVNKYGGFYIARYEAGTDTVRTSSSDTTATVYSKKNMYPYNYISHTNARTLAQGMSNEKTSVTSDLINSAAWDRTLNWLTETKAISIDEMTSDSTSWGNYYNAKFDFTGYYSISYYTNFTEATSSTPKPEDTDYLLGTGVSEYTKRNNIYDLAGNCWEKTTEAFPSDDPVYRGGVYDNNGSYNPASSRYYSMAEGQRHRRRFVPRSTLRKIA